MIQVKQLFCHNITKHISTDKQNTDIFQLLATPISTDDDELLCKNFH